MNSWWMTDNEYLTLKQKYLTAEICGPARKNLSNLSISKPEKRMRNSRNSFQILILELSYYYFLKNICYLFIIVGNVWSTISFRLYALWIYHTVPDSEVNFSGCDILRCDRNRNGGGVACYIRKDLCFNTRTLHCKEIENLVFDILLPKLKPITIGVFYRPPNQGESMVEKLSNLNLKDNEIHLLGDFNINLFQNGKYILNGKRSITSQGSVHTMRNRYKEFYQIHSLKQLITCPTCVTCNTSTLIDRILTDATEKIFQSGIIDSGISSQQLICCIRKVKWVRFHNHNNMLLRSLNHYTINLFVKGLRKMQF